MVERIHEEKKTSGVSKAALATAIGAGVVALGNQNGGGILGGLFGNNSVAPVAATTAAVEASVMLPLMMGAYGNKGYCCDGERHVTKEVLDLTREGAGKDAEIAQLKAERYTLELVDARTAPINARVCELEKLAAVNAARDHDFRCYVEREFIHQPKASIRESIVVCHQCGCNNGTCGCGHGHHGHRDN